MPQPYPALDPSATALLVVDVQDRFRDAVHDCETVIANCTRLVQAFALLELPVFVTEQYPKGLGATVPELRAALDATPAHAKTVFSAYACDAVATGLADAGAQSVVVCGLETHVCIAQTVADLLHAGYRVHVVEDAVSSRRPRDRDVALRRMTLAGAVPTTAEAVPFELMRDATHPLFRTVQALFK